MAGPGQDTHGLQSDAAHSVLLRKQIKREACLAPSLVIFLGMFGKKRLTAILERGWPGSPAAFESHGPQRLLYRLGTV